MNTVTIIRMMNQANTPIVKSTGTEHMVTMKRTPRNTTITAMVTGMVITTVLPRL